eukprot:CAMPEP_0181118100 /NCGR_PEP_ID=MMETSP1071-20121207/22890_1 /TAXON_ID=35127 /ORGANISM="Thalassiosira sp., Strain NH16" /LENGTH=172 /DNA_ID=CAMNT_0023202561 /DNA_START=74 /DNA_END=592 /DNA_ORIENTATION=+
MRATIIFIATLMQFFTIGVINASRIRGGMRTKVEGDKERSLGDLAFSMPKPTDDQNQDIKELLANEGFDTDAISHITTALDLSGARMTGGSHAKELCVSILEGLFDLLVLFSAAVEDAIKVLICNVDEGITTSTTSTTSTTTATCIESGSYGCNGNDDACCGDGGCNQNECI